MTFGHVLIEACRITFCVVLVAFLAWGINEFVGLCNDDDDEDDFGAA